MNKILLQAVNEGLLKTLFGMAKNMFKKDWSTIKGDQNIIKIYKEMDDKLTGYATMKLSKKGECNQIRQALVDFACDWYDYKMNRAKETDNSPQPSKSMKFKDDTLRENLEALEKKIKDIAGKDAKMLKWAQTLLNDMKTVINRSIMNDIEDENVKKEVEKMAKEDEKKNDEENKKMEQLQNKQLEEVKKERETLISNFNVTPISETITGDKEVKNLCTDFNNMKTKDGKGFFKDRLKNDKTLGLPTIFADIEELEKKAATANGGETTETAEEEMSPEEAKKGGQSTNEELPNGTIMFHTMNALYTALGASDVISKFAETPGQSVQAMCIALNSFIKTCVYGNVDGIDKSQLELMAKCAIVSDGVISYNLPLNDAAEKDMNSKDAGNWFTEIAAKLANGQFKIKDEKGKDVALNNDFKANSQKLFKKITDEAAKLKKAGEDKYNEENKKLQTKTDEATEEDLTK